MNKKEIKKNFVIDGFKLLKQIGSGGNSVVWLAKSTNSEDERAIKFFTKADELNRYERFKDEVEVVTNKLHGMAGIVPILNKYLPDDLKNDVAWYSMPVCKPLYEELENLGFIDVLGVFIKLANTLSRLHNIGIAHRDIKPDNMLYYKGCISFSDFGLVDFPEKAGVTRSDERMGPRLILAPEMERLTPDIESMPADVYLLAKSLWISLTNIKNGFEGQYVNDAVVGLIHSSKHSNVYWMPIEKLISDSTSNNPKDRPTANEFASRLEDYLVLIGDFQKLNIVQWEEIQSELFGLSRPVSAAWMDAKEISRVLNLLTKYPSLNHCFLPDGGGNDLLEVKLGFEDDTIELILCPGTADIVVAAKLIYESFPEWQEWNYFRLEIDLADRLILDREPHGCYESLVEISKDQYVSRYCWDNHFWDEKPDEKDVRYITRYLSGTFIFSSTSGPYNNTDSYEGKLNQLTSQEMRNVIQRLINKHSPILSKKTPLKISLQNPRPIIFEPYKLNYLSLELIRKLLKSNDELYIQVTITHKDDSLEPNNLASLKNLFRKNLKTTALEDAVIKLLKSLTPEQLSELYIIINLGRNAQKYDRRKMREYILRGISQTAHLDTRYYLNLVSSRNDYIRKGLSKLDIKV